MNSTTRILYAVTAVIILGVVLLFKLGILAKGAVFLGYPLSEVLQNFFIVPFIYFAWGALFPRWMTKSVSTIIGVCTGAVVYAMLSDLPAWDWNYLLFKVGAILTGGLLMWLFSSKK